MRGGYSCGPEERVAFFPDMRNGQNFAIAETDQAFAQACVRFVVRKPRRAVPCRGQTRREFIQAVNARDFFDQINFALDLGAHHPKNFRARHTDFLWRALSRINVNNTSEQLAAGKLQNQFSSASRGELGHFRIGTAAKPRGGFGVQFQETRSAANRDRFKPRALDQDIFGGKRNFRFRSTHNSADADGVGAVAIADHADVGIELPLDAVEGSHVLAMLGAADNNLRIANLVVIESVQRVAEFEHHEVGNIHDIADAGDAGGFQAVSQPFWGRLDLHVANDAGGEAAAQFRRLNFDSYGRACFRRTLGWLGRNVLQGQPVDGGDFAGDSQVSKAVGAIRADFGFDHCAVRAVLHAADVCAGKGQARGELLGRGSDVDKIFQPVVDDLHASVPVRPRLSEIDAREVFHAYAAVLLMLAKNPFQLGHHRCVVRMTFGRSEGAAAEPPAESLLIQNLVVRQIARGENTAIKETANISALRIGILDPLVVNAEPLKHTFVRAGERGFFHAAVIPEDHHPPAGLKDASKFAARRMPFEPVKSLGGGDEIDAGVAQRGGFGGAGDAREFLEAVQEFFAGFTHLPIRLDAENAMAVFEEQLAKQAGPGADVRDDMVRAQPALDAQEIKHRRGIAGTVAEVVRDAIRKALFGVGQRHSVQNQFLKGRTDGLPMVNSVCFLRELAEKAHVVLEKNLNIIDSVFQHSQAVDAEAEGETAAFLRVVVYKAVDRGIDHARAKEFDPGRALAL